MSNVSLSIPISRTLITKEPKESWIIRNVTIRIHKIWSTNKVIVSSDPHPKVKITWQWLGKSLGKAFISISTLSKRRKSMPSVLASPYGSKMRNLKIWTKSSPDTLRPWDPMPEICSISSITKTLKVANEKWLKNY